MLHMLSSTFILHLRVWHLIRCNLIAAWNVHMQIAYIRPAMSDHSGMYNYSACMI